MTTLSFTLPPGVSFETISASLRAFGVPNVIISFGESQRPDTNILLNSTNMLVLEQVLPTEEINEVIAQPVEEVKNEIPLEKDSEIPVLEDDISYDDEVKTIKNEDNIPLLDLWAYDEEDNGELCAMDIEPENYWRPQ